MVEHLHIFKLVLSKFNNKKFDIFSRYTIRVNLPIPKMTCVYIYIIHYMASIVMANSFFWPQYPFKSF